MKCFIVDSPGIDGIRNPLREFNFAHLGTLQDLTLGCFAETDEGGRIGGVSARIWGEWLLISYMWVDKGKQGGGVGSKLLSLLEEEAKKRGCKAAMVDTLSFQAKPFYEKHGYQCRMTIDDYPVSHKLHFLTKSLISTP